MDKKEILTDLELFRPKEKEKYIEIIMPVVLYMYNNCLVLRVTPIKDGYVISDDGKTFYDFNKDSKYYFDMFMEKDKNFHYDMILLEDLIYKKYPKNFNITIALNEFIRFFLDLDKFVKENKID